MGYDPDCYCIDCVQYRLGVIAEKQALIDQKTVIPETIYAMAARKRTKVLAKRLNNKRNRKAANRRRTVS